MRACFLMVASALMAGFVQAQPSTWHGAPPPAQSPAQSPAPKPSPPAPQQAPPPTVSAAIAFPVRPGESDHMQLGRLLALKFENPEYAAALVARGKIPSSHAMTEEPPVRRTRARLALVRRAPDGTTILAIPRAAAAPTLDGTVQENEWRGALRIALEPADRRGAVLLLAHGSVLYLGALSPPDLTEKGFDQFRFYFHIDLSPFLQSERVFLGGSGHVISLRNVRLPRESTPVPDPPTPASLAQKTDWNMFERARGASKVAGYRQFELAVDLAEAGIVPGVPFPASFEVEGDPEYDNAGKFKARFIIGHAGIVPQPLWLRVTP